LTFPLWLDTLFIPFDQPSQGAHFLAVLRCRSAKAIKLGRHILATTISQNS